MEIRRFLLKALLISAALIPLSAQSSKPVVSGIQAEQTSQGTTISWTIPADCQTDSIASLYVYRSSEAIFSADALSSMAPVAVLTADMTSWTEKAESTLYYYAVVARLTDGSIYDLLIPTVNTTLHAAEVTQSSAEETGVIPLPAETSQTDSIYDGLRIKPLPSFRIFNTTAETQVPLTVDALSAALDLGVAESQEINTNLYIAEEDLAENSTGDTYLLHDIVSRFMLRKNWTRATEGLTALMQTWHSEEITARINLYLGQCSYFTKDYVGALQYFMHSETLYPDVSKIWIQATINAFVLPDFSK